MPHHTQLTTNPLRTRDDLAASLAALLKPLENHFVEGDAGFRLGDTAAHYPPRVAELEGFSRVLWGLAPLLAGGGSSPLTERMLKGIANGTDPAHPAYWGVGGDSDQRQVEMAAFSLALLLRPEVFWAGLPPAQQSNLAAWLHTINGVRLPPTNWEFFRILVNLALRSLGQTYSAERLEAGLSFVDSLYRGDGWYIDETNYDLYNPFAFHFYGLVYARLMGTQDPARAQTYRARAREFALQFVPWFDNEGTQIPHGRSLGYRFAAVSFFSACAFAGEAVLPWGVIKGLVLRHLRWWFAQPIFDAEGLLTIGYRYPNLIMAEQYNSPGSPYWSLKTYLVLALDEGHAFWKAEEAPLPVQPARKDLPVPRLIVCRDARPQEHVWLLSGGQYPAWESVHAAAKYAKFAYSNRFGFCVSHASFDLSKTGCDSMLLFSEGDGYWRERRHNDQRTSGPGWVHSRWSPWTDVVVDTWLVALGAWHARVHRVVSDRVLQTVEGGFSLPDTGVQPAAGPGRLLLTTAEAWGGIVDLSETARTAENHKPEPNLNVLHPKVVVPALRGEIGKGTTWLVCAVAAGMGEVSEWESVPEVELGSGLVRCRTAGAEVLFRP